MNGNPVPASPDSAVGCVDSTEAMLKEKDNEISYLRSTIEQNEQVPLTVLKSVINHHRENEGHFHYEAFWHFQKDIVQHDTPASSLQNHFTMD